jgi:hypothetical protein
VPLRKRGKATKASIISRSDSNWHKSTHLVLSEGNRLLVMQQSPTIRILLAGTFQQVEADVIIDNAFPDAVARDRMIKVAMRKVAKEGGKEFSEIYDHLKGDSDYAMFLSKTV